MKIHLDFETRSAVDIKKCGAWAYAAHPSTDVVCLAYAMDGEQPRVLTGPRIRAGVRIHIPAGVRLVAHSAHFEHAIFNFILHRRYGWPALWDPTLWDCTLARSVTCGMPASLERATIAWGVNAVKDMEGRKAILRACKPIGFDPLDGTPIFDETPSLLERVYLGCQNDVLSEMALDATVPEMTPGERRVFELDLLINRRGFQVDLALARAAKDTAATVTTDLNARLHVLTGGAVEKATRVKGIKDWLATEGVEAESLDKHAVDVLLADPAIPANVKDVLSIRRQVGKSSTAKYTATLDAAGADGRVRGALQYHAAATGRWGGRLVQPQNYPKGLGLKKLPDGSFLDEQAPAVDAVMMEDFAPGFFAQKYGARAMQTLSDILRGTIVAAEGKQLVVADFSAIESRVLLWEADDVIALDKYRRGVNLYVDMAKSIYRREIDKNKDPLEYAVGKATILGAGFGMGAPRFVASCLQAGITITEEFAVTVIRAWREKYRTVVNMWYATERAAIAAVAAPGSVQPAMGGKVLFGMTKDRRFLVCKLPSGRYLWYYKPVLKMIDGPRGEKQELHYQGTGLDGSLEEFKTYGGSLVENITQAIARDLLAHGMLNVEAAGYPVCLQVHDEIVAERNIGEGSLEEFIKLMCDAPTWAAGCPVAAEGWIGRRYRK